ncbi:MAG: hypothetical protein H6873_05735 [Hyphomicrobiaceae bacterium]|nr:hypothetical protein [Hyphomicrobiaceae bacterium]
MRFIPIGIAALALASTAALARDLPRERVFQERFCAGMALEVTDSYHGRADCLTAELAIEVGFMSRWRQDMGQALAYAAANDRTPGLITICDRDENRCLDYHLGLQETLSRYQIAFELWECLPSDMELSDCTHLTIGPSGGQ